jgi:peptidoglycan/xylan/chitin deacetylase (PgdA/CDA1 family)
MRSFVAALALLAALHPLRPAVAGEREMAITFDDLPAQRAQALPEERIVEITDGLLSILTAHGVPAIGFVNENKLEVDGRLSPARVRLLERWLEAGFELGNHSYSHPDLHTTALADYQADVLRGEQVIRPLATARGRPLRYFRHPYLHTGRDLETRDALVDFLAERGYRVAPVTIDNSEWIFARAYDEALDREDASLARRVGEAYVEYLLAMTRYYERQSEVLFGRLFPQVLLLHANSLNARHSGQLLAALETAEYTFVSLDEALADPIYRTPDRYTGPAGITWIHRWAITRGVEGSRFAGEPTTPAWVQETAGVEE